MQYRRSTQELGFTLSNALRTRCVLCRSLQVRERLLFEDMDRASWFSAAGVSGLEVWMGAATEGRSEVSRHAIM